MNVKRFAALCIFIAAKFFFICLQFSLSCVLYLTVKWTYIWIPCIFANAEVNFLLYM